MSDMPAVHVRDVPSEVLAALKRRAARHDRSLQKELRRILVDAAEREPGPRRLPPLHLTLSDAAPPTTWPRSEIYGEDER